MDDLELRAVIYRRIAETGTPPSRDELVAIVGTPDEADARLRRLHDSHMVVLDDRPHRRGEIRMALPFAAEPTGFRVTRNGAGWWANCAWDSLAVVAALRDELIDRVAAHAQSILDLLDDIGLTRQCGDESQSADRAQLVESFEVEVNQAA